MPQWLLTDANTFPSLTLKASLDSAPAECRLSQRKS